MAAAQEALEVQALGGEQAGVEEAVRGQARAVAGEARSICAAGEAATVVVGGQAVAEFVLDGRPKQEAVTGCFGQGTRVTFTGRASLPNGVRLRQKLVLEAWERRMDALVTHPVFGYRISYRRVLEVQARLFGRYLLGELAEFPPFLVR